jgi:hypothetical protein
MPKMFRSNRTPPGPTYGKVDEMYGAQDRDVVLVEYAKKATSLLRYNTYATGILSLTVLLLVTGVGVSTYVGYGFYNDVVKHLIDAHDESAALTPHHINAAAFDAFVTLSNARVMTDFAAGVTQRISEPYGQNADVSAQSSPPHLKTAADAVVENILFASKSASEVLQSIDPSTVAVIVESVSNVVKSFEAQDVVDDLRAVTKDLAATTHIFLKNPALLESMRDGFESAVDVFRNKEFSSSLLRAADAMTNAAKHLTDEIDPADVKMAIHNAATLDLKTDVLPRLDQALALVQWAFGALRRAGEQGPDHQS